MGAFPPRIAVSFVYRSILTDRGSPEMLRIRQLFATTLLLLFALSGMATAKVTPGYDYVPGEVIVKFQPNISAQAKGNIFAAVGGVKVKEFSLIKVEHWKVSNSVPAAVAALENDPRVIYAEPNYIQRIVGIPNDTRFPDLWGMNNTGQTGGVVDADIDAPEAWDVFTGSAGVLVAVIDTGIDYTHPDLVGNAWTNPLEIPGNLIDDDGNGYVDDVHGYDFVNADGDPMDDNNHGTHVSGTIGGTGNNGLGVTGVNWTVSIMGLKFLSAGGSGSTADAISAINYATLMGVDVMSNSWGGGPFDLAMEAAITSAYNAGIFFVAAAGNSGSDNDATPHYPSNYAVPNVISVLATDHNDNPVNEPGWWSTSFGATTVDIGAPGLHIWSSTPGNTYQDFSGTSMATPHISGALALLRGRFPTITVDAGKNLLMTVGSDPLASLTGMCVSGARLNLLKLIADPDTIPPSAVIDLAGGAAGSNWAELVWSAPGDDIAVGTANSYDMRWSLAPITTELDWAAATPASGEPVPSISGSPETMQVHGLAFSTTYYFNIRALDDYGNLGGLSNSASVTTMGAPVATVTPPSLSATLPSGGTTSQLLNVANTGQGVLDFTIPGADYILPVKGSFGPVQTYDYALVGKGQDVNLKPFVGEVGIDATGGPDAFGYTWKDSDTVGGPAFNWIDISLLGTAVTLGDDATSTPFPIGFPFDFYGTTFTTFNICSNGFVSFTDAASPFSNGALPSASAPGNMLALFWDDLNPTAGGSIQYFNDGTRLIVQYTAVPHYGSGGVFTMQLHLYPNGAVEYHYLDVGMISNTGTVGIQNAGGTDGLSTAFNAAYIHNSLAVRYGAIAPWLSTSPNSGSVAAGASVDVTVGFAAAGLCGAAFNATLHVVSNDTANGDIPVPAILNLTAQPAASLSAAALDLGSVFMGQSASLPLTVANVGCAVLNISGLSIDNPAFSIDTAAPFSVNPGGALLMNVSFSPAQLDTNVAVLTLTSDDPASPVQTVDLMGIGLDAGSVAASPSSIWYQVAAVDSSGSTNLSITNNGAGPLNFTIPSPDMYSKHLANLGPVTKVSPVELPKGAADDSFGVAPLGAGGPDLYGYRWSDSDAPGGPVFNWVDISTTGAVALATGDDVNSGPLPIGFTFPFYGTPFTTFNVSSNGFISFTSTMTSYSNKTLPNTAAPMDLIAPFWDDLNLTTAGSGDIFYEVVNGNLVVMFNNLLPYSAANSGTGPFTFEVILSPAGRVTMQYLTMTGVLSSHTIGMQDGTGTTGLEVVYNAAYLHDNMAIEFASLDWLSVSPAAGTIPAGGSLPVTVNFNGTGLAFGLHTGNIQILSDDPITPSLSVPVTFEVGMVVGVEDDILPRVAALNQNVPNPFNPMTTVKFSLPHAGRVALKVYDVRGSLVRTLADEGFTAGTHTRVWMGKNDQGQQVSSGVYFYRLETGDETITKRMTLIK